MLIDAIESLGASDVTISRRTSGTRTAGEYTPGAATTFAIRAIITNNPHNRAYDANGARVVTSRQLITGTELQIGDTCTLEGVFLVAVDVLKTVLGSHVHYTATFAPAEPRSV
ncbi:MAG: hypothetical protein E6Q97_02775 [Desulfurellales bacterium]|nr:MAG: hypothetical protein E6Q97_02775 [Desulfurellales bacterium]